MTYSISNTVEPVRWARPPPRTRSASAGRAIAFDSELVTHAPALRSFAWSLCGSRALADDLVQETCESALAHAKSFTPNTNMRAWLFTILRNKYYTHLRDRRREVEDADGKYADGLTAMPVQNHSVDLADLKAALQRLPRAQCEALLLVGQGGFTYEESALSGRCAVGTIKSRTHRARLRLAALLGAAPPRGGT
jgi:RNA polymerase sigma-70 factor, ECF subfamily